jgi:hypothetical protein
MTALSFDAFFQTATGKPPFPYQREFAEAPSAPQLVDVPTGLATTVQFRRKRLSKDADSAKNRRREPEAA